MLKDNIRTLRKQRGLSQEELSVKLNVVRQTVSKWEQGLSVPDAEMLVSISNVFDTPVSILLGESIGENSSNSLEAISKKLEVINLELLKRKEHKRKSLQYFFITVLIFTLLTLLGIILLGDNYMSLNYKDPEFAVIGVGIHAFVWTFIRIFPIMLIGSIVGIFLTKKK